MPVVETITGSLGTGMLIFTIIIAVIICVTSMWSFFSDVPKSCQGGQDGGKRRINAKIHQFMNKLLR